MVFAVLLATSFVHESDAFAAGGGSFGKKRTFKNQVNDIQFTLRSNLCRIYLQWKTLKTSKYFCFSFISQFSYTFSNASGDRET